MSLSSFVSRIVPIAVGYATGGGPGAVRAAVVTEEQKKRERQEKQRYNQAVAEEQRRQNQMSEIYGTGNLSSVQAPLGGASSTSSGFGAGFRTFATDVGRNILAPISSIAATVAPFFGSRDQFRQPATTRRPILQGTELQTTGQNDAFVGGLGSAIGAASRFLRTPAGSLGTGVLTGLGAGMLGGSPQGIRITRRTKRLAQQAYSLGMGDLGTSIQIFAQLSGLQVNEQEYVLILTKRFRNDGAVVTKAALRKTKTTIRRLKGMCDMYDSLRKAPVRRRTTMKRATGTTLISNK